jgi:radical SAM superfamily enzyme YgiQ (UPF0313 family)
VSVLDVLFVAPSDISGIYQDLGLKQSAIEPPTWALLLAQSCRAKGFKVGIYDPGAESHNLEQQCSKILKTTARLVVFVVYGQNVNAGTANMSGAVKLSRQLKTLEYPVPIALIGSYVQALPRKTLQDELSFDFAFSNEGVYALWKVLEIERFDFVSLAKIPGLVLRDGDDIKITEPSLLVPTQRMDVDLPGYAWDLLPFQNQPLDLYRAPYWHAEYSESNRTPYVAIQTSLGCNFGCSFCMINIINRNDSEEVGVASRYKGMRFWSTDFVVEQFDVLNKLGVKTIKVTDEMFLLYKKHYEPICRELSNKSYAKDLIMWSYSRVDTVGKPETLELVRAAGFRWLALGVESGEKSVRLEVTKGNFEDVDIHEVVRRVEDAGINVMANYIVGLPGDTQESMKSTYDLSVQLNTAGWNMYAAMALPGSELYSIALQKGEKLPESFEGFSFHGYNSQPLPTLHLSPSEILSFRDKAFVDYHQRPEFLEKIGRLYGESAKENVITNSKLKLKRRLIDESNTN